MHDRSRCELNGVVVIGIREIVGGAALIRDVAGPSTGGEAGKPYGAKGA